VEGPITEDDTIIDPIIDAITVGIIGVVVVDNKTKVVQWQTFR